jgi:hypothetical protein
MGGDEKLLSFFCFIFQYRYEVTSTVTGLQSAEKIQRSRATFSYPRNSRSSKKLLGLQIIRHRDCGNVHTKTATKRLPFLALGQVNKAVLTYTKNRRTL